MIASLNECMDQLGSFYEIRFLLMMWVPLHIGNSEQFWVKNHEHISKPNSLGMGETYWSYGQTWYIGCWHEWTVVGERE